MVMRRDDGGLLPGDTISTRRLLDIGPGSSLPGTISGGSDTPALISAINNLGGKVDTLAQLLALQAGAGINQVQSSIVAFGQPVQFEAISLASAHAAREVSVAAGYTYCQVWCDGHMEGVTVRLGSQSNAPIDLSRFNGFPIPLGTNKAYITNDVRPGRSALVLGFGAGHPMATADLQAELHELAARTGSLISFDRRGRFVWGDNFAGTQLRWTYTTVGAASMANLTTTVPYEGDQCCHVVTDANINDYCCIHRMMHLPLDKAIGFQSAFRMDPVWDNASIYFIVRLYNGTNMLDASFRLRRLAGAWTAAYMNSAGAYTVVASAWEPRLADTWHRIKAVIDGSNSRWVRAMLDDQVIDLSSLALYPTPDTTQGLDMHIQTMTLGAAAREAWFDAAVITDCEPVDILG